MEKQAEKLITLSEAAVTSGYARGHLNLLSRSGVLKATKLGRNWYTTKSWLNELIKLKEQQKIINIKNASSKLMGEKDAGNDRIDNGQEIIVRIIEEANAVQKIAPIQIEAVDTVETISAIQPIQLKCKLPIFKERLVRFALTFLFFWGASVGLAYVFANRQIEAAPQKKSAADLRLSDGMALAEDPIFNPQSFSENYQDKIENILGALNFSRDNFSPKLNQKYFPDNSNASQLLALNTPAKISEPKVAGAEISLEPQPEINIPPLSQDVWRFLFFGGFALLTALLIFWFFYSVRHVFLQPVGVFGWIVIIIFFLAGSLTINQFIRQSLWPERNEVELNLSASNLEKGVKVSGEKPNQAMMVTAAEMNAKLLSYVSKDSLKKGQALAGDVYLDWEEKLKLDKDSIRSREIVRHAIEAEDIDTGSVTSRTIRNHTIQGKDISPETNIVVADILSDQATTETLIVTRQATIPILNVTSLIDFGTNTIADGNSVGDWDFNGGNLTTTGTLNAGAVALSDNLDLQNNIIQNIGNAGTDFTATGGLNLAGDLYVADDLEVAGTIYGSIAGSFAPTGDVDMATHIITNIGNNGTDFDTSGGLTLAGQLNVNGAGNNYFAGNVGIGTTNPGAFNLNVSTNAIFGGSSGIAITGTNIARVGTQTLNLGDSNDTLNLGNNSMYVLPSGGNVGIGTTSPTSVLHLKAGTATAGTAPLGFTSGTLLTVPVAGKVEFLTDAWYGTITTGAERKQFAFTSDLTTGYVPYTGATGSLDLGTFSLTTPLVLGGISTTQDLTFKTTSGVGTTGADMHFLVGNNGGTEAMTILNNGNVGIGTTTPGAALSVGSGSIEVRGGGVVKTYSADGTNHASISVSNGSGASFSQYSGDFTVHSVSFQWAFDLKGGSSSIISNAGESTRSLSLKTINGKDIFIAPALNTVFSSGNVGIGVTSPLAYLQIKAGTAAVNTAPLKFTTGVNLTTAEAGAMEYDGTELYFTPSGTTRETIAYLSDITGAAHNAVTINATANGLSVDGSQVLTLSLASAGVTGALSGTDWSTFNAKESALTFSSGLTRATNTITNNLITGLAGGQTIIGGTGTTDDLIFKTTTGVGASGADMIFQTGSNGGTEAMRIAYNGNVGINLATAPAGNLDIRQRADGNDIIYSRRFTDTSSTGNFLHFLNAAGDTDIFSLSTTGSLSLDGGSIVHDASTGITTIDNLQLGAMNFPTDGGIVSWIDMPVTSAAVDNTVESYTAQLDGNPMLTIYGLADGAGGVDTLGVGILNSTPAYPLDVLGAIRTGGAGTDGTLHIYSEQGATDYTASLFANTAMTSAASFYLPADEPAGTYLLNMTNGGVIGYDTNTYLTSSTGANTALSNLSSVAINTHLIPDSNDDTDLGSTSLRWQDLYLGPGSIHLGTSATAEGLISYTDTTQDVFNFGTDAVGGADIAFFTDDLYLDKSTGNVGIGTTNPGAGLHVIKTTEQLRLGYDASRYLSATVNSTGGAALYNSGVNKSFTISTNYGGSGGTVAASFGYNGYIGNGIVTPALGIGGALTSLSATGNVLNVTGYAGINFTSNSDDGSTMYMTPGYSGGRLGIGNAAPLSKLGVTGNASIGATYGVIAAPTSGMIIEGNVGIGTTSPGQKLDIQSGALRFSYVTTATAPTLALSGTPGNVPNGTHDYAVQFINAIGDGLVSPITTITITDKTVSGQVIVTIPVSPDPTVTNRRIWRRDDSGGWFAFTVGTINNNTTTSFTDNLTLPPDGYGVLPTIDYTSGALFAGSARAATIDSLGNIATAKGLSVNGGRFVDNNGTLGMGVLFGSLKTGIYVTDNFAYDSKSAGVSVVTSAAGSSKIGVYSSRQASTFSVNPATPAGQAFMGETNAAAGAYTTNVFGGRASISNVANSGNHIIYNALPYLLGTGNASGSIYNFNSSGQFATTGSTVNNLYDFSAQEWSGIAAGGTITNRYGLYLGFTNTNTTNAWGIYQSSNTLKNYFAGNVGIGTTNPVAKEHIKGSGTSGQVTSSWILENASSGTLGLDITGNAGSSYARWLYGGGPSTGTNILTPGMVMMLEGSSAGNVGIGTTGPTNKLRVAGDIGAVGDIVAYGSGTSVWAGNGNNYTYIKEGTTGTINTYGGFGINVNVAATRALTILTSGNVGIGTTSPLGNLDVIRVANDSGNILRLGNVSGSGTAFNFARNSVTGALSIQGEQVGNNNIVLAPTSGNVGIGTTGPGAKLDVSGTIASTPTIRVIGSDTASYGLLQVGLNVSDAGSVGARMVLGDVGTGGKRWDVTSGGVTAGALTFRNNTDSVNAVTILSTGNVGIGTTTPSGLLHSKVSNAAVTATSYDGYFENLATNTTTDAIDKYGTYITSTGTFTGSTGTATNNYGLYIATTGGGDNNYDIYAQSGANLTTTGTWTNAPSYRAYKGTYADTGSYLDKLMTMDVYEWQYKDKTIDGMNRFASDPNRHASPFLDDFYNTFGLGNIKGYNIQDLAGVTIASVKELNTRFIAENEEVNLQLITNDQQLTELNLKTDQNITTLQGLQTSVDEQLTIIQQNIQSQGPTLAGLRSDLDQLALTLQAQIDELKKINNQELNVAQIEANTTDIEYLKTLLGITPTSAPGDVSILGKLEVEGVVAGAFTVRIKKGAETIGTAHINAGETKVMVETAVVDANSKIFISPQALKPLKNPLTKTDVLIGEGFAVEIMEPAEENIAFDWWIVRTE